MDSPSLIQLSHNFVLISELVTASSHSNSHCIFLFPPTLLKITEIYDDATFPSEHWELISLYSSLVFRMVEAEEEYVEQLEILISCFLRPFKMAASSKAPPCSHEDINSIFLNSETVLFLHQIFLKGLTARMDSWPTLVLGTSLGDYPLYSF